MPDVWATNGHDTAIIEVKTSHSDFLADHKKWIRQEGYAQDRNKIGNYRYYLCPKGVIKEEELPENWGLLVWDGKKIHKVKQAVRVDTYAHGELLMITSIMSRILRPQIFNFREKQEIKLIEDKESSNE